MLLGRDRERQELAALLADARLNQSGVLVVAGDVGIGKSALLDDAAEHARDAGMRLVRARGIESEARVPFAALLELLRPALGALERIPAPQAAALEGALALRPAAAEDRFAVGAATLSLLAAYAEDAPLVALIDDAHWLDGSSADALLFAVRRLVADPIAVVVAVRDGEPSFVDGAGLRLLRLEGLDRDAAAALVGDTAADRLHRATGGNPLALLELATDASQLADVPLDTPTPIVGRVAAGFVERAGALPREAREALLLAAASDRGDLDTLERAHPHVTENLAAAESAGLVELREGRVEFRHPLARSALYGAATPDERRSAHRTLAAALPDAERDRRAWHLALATVGPDAVAASALEQAGTRAHARSAYAVAATAYERAATLSADRAPLLHAAADASWLAGRLDRARALVHAAREQTADPRLAVRIEHLHGQIAARSGPVPVAQRILTETAEQAATFDPAAAVVMLAQATQQSFYAGDAESMLRTARRAIELAARANGRAGILANLAHGMALVFSGEGDAGAEAIRHAIEQLEASDELRNDPHLVVWAALGPLWLRDAAIGRALYERAVELVRSRTAVGALPELLVHIARDWATTTEWAAAHVSYTEAIALARESGQDVALGFGLSGVAWLEARQGREEACRDHAAEGRQVCVRAGMAANELWAIAALGDLELGLGRPEAALGHYEEWEALLRAHGIADADLSPGPELAETLLRLGRRADAAEVAARHDELAQARGRPWSRARAARIRGLLANGDDFESDFAAAAALHEQTPDVYEAARTQLAYGTRLRRAGTRKRAREELRSAIDAFDHLGAAPWAELARTEFDATGETARRRDVTTLDELTPQELQISLLLAEGRTTREAAAAMFLSPKTIEYHLRNVYRKLNVHSRPELTEAIARLRS
jgi:DNA-binding CsgD family transcriptional regulator